MSTQYKFCDCDFRKCRMIVSQEMELEKLLSKLSSEDNGEKEVSDGEENNDQTTLLPAEVCQRSPSCTS